MISSNKAISIFIFAFSYLWLLAIWTIMANVLLVPWDATSTENRPALGSVSRTLNDYFEVGFGAYLPVIVLVTISLTIVYLGIKRNKKNKKYSVLEKFAAYNFLYIGLLLLLFLLLILVIPPPKKIGYNSMAIVLNIIAISMLFAFQYRNVVRNKNTASN